MGNSIDALLTLRTYVSEPLGDISDLEDYFSKAAEDKEQLEKLEKEHFRAEDFGKQASKLSRVLVHKQIKANLARDGFTKAVNLPKILVDRQEDSGLPTFMIASLLEDELSMKISIKGDRENPVKVHSLSEFGDWLPKCYKDLAKLNRDNRSWWEKNIQKLPAPKLEFYARVEGCLTSEAIETCNRFKKACGFEPEFYILAQVTDWDRHHCGSKLHNSVVSERVLILAWCAQEVWVVTPTTLVSFEKALKSS